MTDYLHEGDRGIDFSSYRLNPPGAAVPDGCKFLLRYSAGAASTPGHPSYALNKPKLITPAEYAGLDPYYVMLANSEWYEGRVTEGDAAGFEDGQADYTLWRSCGYPRGYPVFCSWDKYPAASDDAGVAGYLRGHQRGMDAAAGGRYYITDLYAGENGIRRMRGQGLVPIGWRTMALSWNDNIPAGQTVATIVQTGNYWFGQQADENVMARDLALPAGTGEDMPNLDQTDLDRITAIVITQARAAIPLMLRQDNDTRTAFRGLVQQAIPPVDQAALERAVVDAVAAALAGGVPVGTVEAEVLSALGKATIPVALTGTAGTVPPVTP